MVAMSLAVAQEAPVQVQRSTPLAGPASEVAMSYYRHVAERLEAAADTDWPKRKGKRLYGRVYVRLTIAATGQVLSVEILASTSATLADHSRTLLREAGPFDAFSPELAARADQLVIENWLRYTRVR